MAERLRIGLIGVGGIGARHLEVIELLQTEGLVELCCVADPFVERLANMKTVLEARGVRWYSDFERLMEQESELDAMVIATPVPLHARMTAAALARGMFVYLEKPPVPLIQQLNDLVSLDTRRKVAVGFQMVSHVGARQLKRWATDGSLGEIRQVRASAVWPRATSYYNRASWAGKLLLNDEPVFDGPATNALAHLLHNLMYFAGKDVDSFDVPVELQGELYRARPIESYDLACIRGRFESGVTFSFAVSHASHVPAPYRLEIVGTKGKAWIADDGNEVGNDCGLKNPVGPFPDCFTDSHREFVDFAAGRRPRAVTSLEDTRGYVLTTNGAMVSSAGIHSLDPQHWKTHGEGSELIYEIPNLGEIIRLSAQEAKLFSEMNLPWARKAHAVLVHNLRSINLKDYISQ